MNILRKNGSTSNIRRIKLRRSDTGQGLTGLSSSSSGLIISTICDNEASATVYTQSGGTIETITTLGTFATPTATKCRFKEVDATNHPGLYELQLADARYAVSGAKTLLISISGATTLLEKEILIQLTAVDFDDAVRGGMTALPNAAAGASGGLPLSVDSSGRVDVLKINGTSQTARDIGASVLLSSGTGTGQLDFTSGVVKANAVQLLGTAWLTPGTAGTPDVNAKLLGGTAQTGRDVGASVLLSSGTGTGQLDFSSGVLKGNVTQINGTSIAGTGTRVADAFVTLFNVATPVLTTASVNQTGDSYARLGSPVGASHSADVAAVKSDTAAVKTKTDFLPSATAGASNGLLISGSNSGTTTFGAITVTGALTVSGGASLTNASGFGLYVSGSGGGGYFTAGTSGSGIYIEGVGAPSLYVYSETDEAVKAVTIGTNKDAVKFVGDGTGHGLQSTINGALTGTGTLPVNVTEIDGAATSGPNARLNLKQLFIYSDDSEAVRIQTTDSSSPALLVSSNGGGQPAASFFASDSDCLLLTVDGSGYGINGTIHGAITNSGLMPSYTQPTGFLAATFPATVASTTNITAGTITTVTNLTNAPTAGDFTAAMKTSLNAATPASVVGAVGSVASRVTANTDQLAGQTVTAAAGVTFPTSVASPTNITAGTITTVTNLTNAPTAGDFTSTMKTSLNNATPVVTVSDKTGFSLSSAGVQAIWDALSSALTTAGSIGKRIVDYLTGDAYTRIGATGAGLTSLAPASTALSTSVWTNTKAGYLDAKISEISGGGGGGSGLDGPSSVTLTFLDADSSPVPLVDFTILGQGVGRSDTEGVAAFGLEDGEYTVVARPTNGVLFASSPLSVSGTTTLDITGTSIPVPVSSDPLTTTAYLYTYDAHGAVAPHVRVDFQLVTGPDANSYPTSIFHTRSGSDGLLSTALLRSGVYKARRGEKGEWVSFTAGSGTTYALPAILGTP